jgi:hypothetical protein
MAGGNVKKKLGPCSFLVKICEGVKDPRIDGYYQLILPEAHKLLAPIAVRVNL